MPSLILLCILLIVSADDVVLAGDGEFIYNGFTGSKLQLDGAASITQDGILTLTTSSYDIQGHAFHPVPLPFVDSALRSLSFSATFVFAITSNYSAHSGDGMAFVISLASNLSSASAGGSLGLVDLYGSSSSNNFFAIELDTNENPEFEDIDDNHVGIDLNNLTSSISKPAGYRYFDNFALPSFESLRLSSGNPMQVWVDYDGNSMQLDVTLALVPMDKPSSPLFSYTGVNLSTVLGVSPMNNAYVGFSASTGERRASHQILGWSFNLGGPAKPLNYSLLPLKRVQQDRQQANKKDFVKWFSAAISVLAILAGITACLVLRYLWKKTGTTKESEDSFSLTISVLAILAGVTACLVLRRYLWKKNAERQEDWEAELGPRRFAYKDLRRATNGFSSTQMLGKGGFGCVYGGVLHPSGVRVAVKRISPESTQGLKQFTAEIIILGRLRHRNLVRLIGYCRHKDDLLLVYKHMPHGSLDRFLHGQNKHALVWPQRFHIIKCVAAGLLYLHEDWEQVIVHRDVKASNVLLDGEMNGRLGDFGLARLHDHGVDAHTTHVAGTRGYLAPELTRFGKATKATDVFAFGAFILEVACGRRPVGLNARGMLLVLVEWVRDVWASGSIVDTVDPRLEDYAADEAELVLKLGLLCSHSLPAARPGMRLVMQYLDGDLPLPEFSPGYLGITEVDQVLEAAPQWRLRSQVCLEEDDPSGSIN